MEEKYPVIDMVETGKRIRFYIEINDLSIKDIQSYLGLSCPQGIYKWLNGSAIPTVDNLYALSQLFAIPMDDLIGGNRKELYELNRRMSLYDKVKACFAEIERKTA